LGEAIAAGWVEVTDRASASVTDLVLRNRGTKIVLVMDVAGVNGTIAGADVFDQPRTAAILWSKLVRSYAMDAIDQGPAAPVDHAQAMQFLARSQDARCEVFPSLALGEEVQLEGHGVVGAALVCRSTPVHIGLFRADIRVRDERHTSSTRMSSASQAGGGSTPNSKRDERSTAASADGQRTNCMGGS